MSFERRIRTLLVSPPRPPLEHYVVHRYLALFAPNTRARIWQQRLLRGRLAPLGPPLEVIDFFGLINQDPLGLPIEDVWHIYGDAVKLHHIFVA